MANPFTGLPAQFLMTLLGAREQEKTLDEFNAANQARLDEIRGLFDRFDTFGKDQMAKGHAHQNKFLLDNKNNTMADVDALMRQIGGGYDARTNDVMGAYNTATGGALRGYDALGNRLNTMLTNRSDRLNQQDLAREMQAANDLAGAESRTLGTLQNRYDRNMGYLEGQGEQERRDINESFDNQNVRLKGDLQRRGLTGSTILPSMQQGLERRRSDSLGGLNERVNRQKISTDSALSGDIANAQQAFGMFSPELMSRLSGQRLGRLQGTTGDVATSRGQIGMAGLGQKGRFAEGGARLQAGLTGDALRAQDSLGRYGIGMEDMYDMRRLGQYKDHLNQKMGHRKDVTGMHTGVLERVTDTMPQNNVFNQLAGIMGQAYAADKQAQAMQAQNDNSWLGPALGAVGTIGGSLVGAPWLGALAGGAGGLFGGGGGGAPGMGNYGPIGRPLDYRTGYTSVY